MQLQAFGLFALNTIWALPNVEDGVRMLRPESRMRCLRTKLESIMFSRMVFRSARLKFILEPLGHLLIIIHRLSLAAIATISFFRHRRRSLSLHCRNGCGNTTRKHRLIKYIRERRQCF